MNKFKRELIVLAILLVVSTFISIYFFSEFKQSDIVEVPIHWNINNEPDNFAPPWIACLIGPAVILLIMTATIGMSRKMYNDREIKTTRFVIILIAALMTFINWVALSSALNLGKSGFNLQLIHLGLGIVFVLLGNQMGKLPYSKWVGIRVPATLNNEEVWNRVHNKSGKLMVISGLCIIAAVILGDRPGALYFYIPLVVSLILMIFVIPARVKRQVDEESSIDD